MSRNPKGSVVVENFQGRLRLRLPAYCPTRYLTLGLADNARNRKIAGHKAAQIEADLVFERFDPTLDKYKNPLQISADKTPLLEIWEAYAKTRIDLSVTTINTDFKRVRERLVACPVTLDKSQVFKNWLSKNYKPGSVRRILLQLRAACKWAIDQGMIQGNPFESLPKKIQSATEPDPFTRRERDAIINGFRSSRYYSYYTDYVRFLFWTGARTSEAIALKWKHINPGLEYIIFCEALVNRQVKDTKTHKPRRFPLNQSLKLLLSNICPDPINPDQLVFRSKEGLAIDPHNFLNRAWRSILVQAGIRYRPQYSTRHTFITLCLEKGVPVSQISKWVGNSPKTIWQHYAGIIDTVAVPEP
ncbi:tyrosine-type recombinase/integrase [Coleofasciculus sp. G2-EDA-02]|uniref:tyrosine-type recombinase/integrase n=1 Tax=Coleofasciculus sp. G2-EDA-02 TaxID=3069529 RepID=UPI0032FD40AF